MLRPVQVAIYSRLKFIDIATRAVHKHHDGKWGLLTFHGIETGDVHSYRKLQMGIVYALSGSQQVQRIGIINPGAYYF